MIVYFGPTFNTAFLLTGGSTATVKGELSVADFLVNFFKGCE